MSVGSDPAADALDAAWAAAAVAAVAAAIAAAAAAVAAAAAGVDMIGHFKAVRGTSLPRRRLEFGGGSSDEKLSQAALPLPPLPQTQSIGMAGTAYPVHSCRNGFIQAGVKGGAAAYGSKLSSGVEAHSPR